MRKILLFFSLISFFCFSQQKNLKIVDLQPKSENFVFPLVSYPEKPLIQNKINTFLQVSELEYIPGTGKNPFQFASTATNSYSNYVYYYNWEKLGTPQNILSLKMEGEASGAYPEGFNDYQNFDLRTGNLINIKELFRPEAVDSVNLIVNENIIKEISAFLNELKSSENLHEADEQIKMYEECLEYVDGVTLEYVKFFFGKDKLTIVKERCSNHAMRALDDLGKFEIELPFAKIDRYWSSYARNLLSENGKMVKQNTIQNRLYKGAIDGKYPVTVLIKDVYDDGSFSAFYWYDKTKKLIEWSGTLKNTHLSIIENDYHSEELKKWVPRVIIKANVNGNAIVGTWQDYKTKKFLKLELKEI